MTLRRNLLHCLFSGLLLLTQCARLSPNTVSVVGRNFEDEVQQTQNLTFTFSRNVGPEGRLNQWDSTQYVRFTPAVQGKFRWTSPSELVFSPAVAFEPATKYRAELTDKLLQAAENKELRVSDEAIAFHTPYLQLSNIETWWTRARDTGSPVARMRLRFNYPVPAGDVASRLHVVANEQPLTTQLLATDAPDGLMLTLTNATTGTGEARPGEARPGEARPLAVRVDKGVAVPNTAYRSEEAIEQRSELPSQRQIDVVDVVTGYEQGQGTVRVVTTQELQPGNLADYYVIQPAVATTAELTENGLLIRGDFNETDTYVLTLTERVRGVLGATLAEPVSRDLFFGQMPASIQFASKRALYLPARGARNVGLHVVNVPDVQVQIAKVYENNLLPFLRGNRYAEYTLQGDTWGPSGAYSYSRDDAGHFSDVLVNKTVSTTDLPRVRGVSALNIALPSQPFDGPPPRGVYLVSVASTTEAYMAATQLVAVSDIGLVARQTPDEVLVWANSLETAEPLTDVDVTLVSSSNQTLMTGKTNADGLVRFEKIAEKAPGFGVALITARRSDNERSDDFTFLHLPDTQVETSRFDVAGARDNASGFSAFVYGDRDIYRPGETMHLNTLVRTQGWKSAADVPLTVRILLPNGREYRALRKQTNNEGAVTLDVPLDPAAVTGTYTVEVLNANNVLLTAQPVSVEEFLPDRIKVDVVTDRSAYRSGQTITVSATALNLFGPPAADRAYETELQLRPKVFAPKGFAHYSFSLAGDAQATTRGTTLQKDVRQGRTNANGQFTERFALPTTYQDIGLLEGRLYVTVFDENGRPVNRLRRFDVRTQDVFYGVRLPDRYVATNSPLPVDVVALDVAGALRAAPAQVEVVRYEYQTLIEKQEKTNQIRYVTKRRERSVYANTLPMTGGRGQFRYVPALSGEYAVRIRRPGAAGYTETDFYAYGWSSTTASSFDVSQEGQVLMTFDKPAYAPGERAKVLFKTPFNGKLLITVERNRVLEHHWLVTNNRSAEWTFKTADEHLPNVYVTATLVRPLRTDGPASEQLPLTVAHGFASVGVSDPDNQLPVTITAADRSRSKTKQTIRVKTKAGAQVTVAVVDEGILQLKNFQTPDPHGFFYQKRALEVGAHDLYAQLFPELSLRSRSSTGGDGYDLQKRVNPLSNGRVKLVALWSGILETGFDGEAEFTVDVPQFSGDLRVMAVAYKGNAFGSASRNLTVADPIVISAGVPRFLSPGDQLELPVNLTNTTGRPANVVANVVVSGPLALDSVASRRLTIPAGRETRTTFYLKARQAIGPGAIEVRVAGLGETFTERTDLTVRPAASLVKTSVAGSVAAGQAQPIRFGPDSVLPGTARASLTLSRSPGMQYAPALAQLLGYPHGCLEQTISKAFPQLYFADLARNVAKGRVYYVRQSAGDLNPASNVQQAVQQVENSQLNNGGFMRWPGYPQEDPWASVYALHFLTEAGRAGYEVRPDVVSKAIDYLTTRTSNPATEELITYDETGSSTVRNVASRTNLYGLYVLTVAGKPNRAAMNYYKQNNKRLTPDSRYLLAAAFARIGDQRGYAALLPKRYVDPTQQRETGGSYASPIRNLALALHTLIDTDPDNLQIPTLARQLSQAVRQPDALTTQEAAFAFLALGKLARQTAASNVVANVANARGQLLGRFSGQELVLRLPAGQPVTVRATGQGRVYYFGQREGIPARGNVVEADNGLRVRRAFLDRNGQPVSQFRQHDLVVVKLTVASTNGLPIENVVVTDLLPAGFEIENPRLTAPASTDDESAPTGGARDLSWASNASQPDHFDVRDDRINYYTTAGAEPRTFYYVVRAVSRGTFRLGPVSADAMYNPDYRSYAGAGTVRID